MSLTVQIAEVNKAMGSVSYMVDHGYQVVFEKGEATGMDLSRMTHKLTGITTRFRRIRNVWVLDAFIEVEDEQGPFPRQA